MDVEERQRRDAVFLAIEARYPDTDSQDGSVKCRDCGETINCDCGCHSCDDDDDDDD